MTVQDLRVDLEPWIDQAKFAAKRRILSQILEGEWTSASKGKGIEFAGFRVYTSGDDATAIDWKASMKADDLLVKEYEEYRSFSVHILVDVSDSMLFTSTEKLKAEFAAQFAYVFGDAVKNAGDPVSIVMFNEGIQATTTPAKSRKANDAMRGILTDGDNYGGGKNLRRAIHLTRSRARGKAAIVIVSDFLGLKSDWKQALKSLGDDFDVLGIKITDPRDKQLPKTGRVVLQNPFEHENVYVNVDSIRDEYTEKAEQHVEDLKRVFRKANGDLVEIMTTDDYMSTMIQYFKHRKKMVV